MVQNATKTLSIFVIKQKSY